MSTQKQIEANQRNARLSTGPRTVEGKERSRANAYKHGLTAVVVTPMEDQQEVETERDRWIATLMPGNDIATRVADLSFQLYRRLKRNLNSDDSRAARRAKRARQAYRKQLDNELDGKKELLNTNLAEFRDYVTSSYYGAEWMLSVFDDLLAELERDEWSLSNLKTFLLVQGKSMEELDDATREAVLICVAQADVVARLRAPNAGEVRPRDLCEMEARFLKKPNPGEVPPLRADQYERFDDRARGWNQHVERLREELSRQTKRLAPQVAEAKAHLRTLIGRAQEWARDLMDLHADTYESELDERMNVALVDTSDAGKLRHRYLVDARRDFAAGLADAERVCGVKIAEATTPDDAEAPADDAPPADPSPAPTQENKGSEPSPGSRNEPISEVGHTRVCDDSDGANPSTVAFPTALDPPSRV
jgi:hypothetical protein